MNFAEFSREVLQFIMLIFVGVKRLKIYISTELISLEINKLTVGESIISRMHMTVALLR